MLALIATALLASAPVDLELHAGASALVSADLYALATAHDAPVAKRFLIAGGVTLAVGAAKELFWDAALHQGDPSWRDFGADVLGAASGLFISWAVDQLLSSPKPEKPRPKR